MKNEALKLADELIEDVKWLVALNTDLPEKLVKTSDMIRKLVAELDEQGEPVAWMSKHGSFIGKIKDEICHIPLYTALQTKPLSDDAIDHIWFNYGWESVEKKDLHRLVRAIEKRHGIK